MPFSGFCCWCPDPILSSSTLLNPLAASWVWSLTCGEIDAASCNRVCLFDDFFLWGARVVLLLGSYHFYCSKTFCQIVSCVAKFHESCFYSRRYSLWGQFHSNKQVHSVFCSLNTLTPQELPFCCFVNPGEKLGT
jgi:hypothetical protein